MFEQQSRVKIGFTGTQHGMTIHQKKSIKAFLRLYPNAEFHHGDCIGSDAEAHDIAKALNLIPIIHPPTIDDKRAFKQATKMYSPKPYLDRNKDIVDETDFLIATPHESINKLRSGTWSTIRYAVKTNKSVYIIWPDGHVSESIKNES